MSAKPNLATVLRSETPTPQAVENPKQGTRPPLNFRRLPRNPAEDFATSTELSSHLSALRNLKQGDPELDTNAEETFDSVNFSKPPSAVEKTKANVVKLEKTDQKQPTPLFSRAESLFLYALDKVNTENHKCLALRDNLAVCGPAPDNFMNDVLIEREKVETVMNGVECFTVAQAEGGEMLEVCAPSRMEAHLQMQAIGLQFAEIGAKMR